MTLRAAGSSLSQVLPWVSVGGIRPHEDLEVAVIGNRDVVEIDMAEHGHLLVAPEARHRLDRRPVGTLGIAPDAIAMRPVEKGVVVEEIGVLRAPAQFERHEERLGVERGILLARRDIHVERDGLEVAQEVMPLRQNLRIGGMFVREQVAARRGHGPVPNRLRLCDGRWGMFAHGWNLSCRTVSHRSRTCCQRANRKGPGSGALHGFT